MSAAGKRAETGPTGIPIFSLGHSGQQVYPGVHCDGVGRRRGAGKTRFPGDVCAVTVSGNETDSVFWRRGPVSHCS